MGRLRGTTVFVLLAMLGLLVALVLGNPYSDAWWLKCPLRVLTGYQCPFCGMQRQVHSLLTLQWGEAWRLNPVLLLSYPYWLVLFFSACFPRWRDNRWVALCRSDKTIFFVIGILLLWGVARNVW